MLGHILYNALNYLPIAILLVFFILIAPALAFFPTLIKKPIATAAIPLLSILIVTVIAFLLYYFAIYQHEVVVAISVILAIVAAIRFCRVYPQSQWNSADKSILVLNFSLLIPMIPMAGLSSFMSNDALASWNYWALHFYMGERPDTLGYPPFFPLFISYCYKLLGHWNYQGPVKVLLLAFPFTILNCIAFSAQNIREKILQYLILVSVCVVPGFLTFGFYRFYTIGYADPMLASSIALSLAMTIFYLRDNKFSYLLIAIASAVLASLSKQPGLLWALVCLPIVLVYHFMKVANFRNSNWAMLPILFIPAGIWLLGPGSHFYHNQGVLQASLQNHELNIRNIYATFFLSLEQYLLLQPTLLLLFTGAWLACYKNIEQRLIYLMFILPGILLWFTLGAYDIRLGLQLIVAAGILIAANNFYFSANIFQFSLTARAASYVFLIIGSLGFCILSITEQTNPHVNVPYQIYPLNSAKSNIHHFFGDQAEYIYQQIYLKPDVRIYAPERMIAGMFYGNHIMLPAAAGDDERLIQFWQREKPDYVFAAFCDRNYVECVQARRIAKKYPNLLQKIPIKNSVYDHELYQFNWHPKRS